MTAREHAETIRAALHSLATLAGNFDADLAAAPKLVNEQVATIAVALDALVQQAEDTEASDEYFRLIAQHAGADGTSPEDWQAMTYPAKAVYALDAVIELRADYDNSDVARSALGQDT